MHASPETAAVCSAAAAAAAAAAAGEPILHTGVRNDQTPKVFLFKRADNGAINSPPHFFLLQTPKSLLRRRSPLFRVGRTNLALAAEHKFPLIKIAMKRERKLVSAVHDCRN